jgi:outer membrane lipoprotein-sorting protein
MMQINKADNLWAVVLLFLCCTVLLCGAISTQADSLFDQSIERVESDDKLMGLAKRLANPSVIRSNFQQQKKLKILRKPMISRGTMIYAKDYGLYWHIETPFPSTLIITETALQQKDGDNVNTITAKNQPVLFGFSQVFFKLLSGDIAALSQHFKLHYQMEGSRWRIGLLPKDSAMQQFIKQVTLQGGDLMDTVDIIDNTGDSTHIEFTATNTAPFTDPLTGTLNGTKAADKQLTDVERGYFEF